MPIAAATSMLSGLSMPFGAKPLRDETSVNLSGGVAFSASDNFTLTADVFHIKLNNRILLGATYVAYTQQTPPPQLTIEQVKDNLYMVVGDGGNVGVYVTNEGVVLVDDKYEQDYDQILARVKRPIRTLRACGIL